MRFITEGELRDAFAQGVPERYAPPDGAQLTPAARGYLMDLRLYKPGSVQARPGTAGKEGTRKPEHMTSLDGRELVSKAHPRIALRGLLDEVEAEILLTQVACLRQGQDKLSDRLQEALKLVREVLAADVTGLELADWTLDDMTPAQVREASHNPGAYTGGGHVLPDARQGEIPALLNKLRACVRRAEVQAVLAFGEGRREDLVTALNRLSSYFYVLQLRTIAGREG